MTLIGKHRCKRIVDTIMTQTAFPLGSVLKAHRGLYFHYGVYVGGGKVVHFSSKGKREMEAASADIIITTLRTFAKGDKVSLDTLEAATFSPEEIAQRAISAIGTKKGTYNLISNNCEHFANWCRCGQLISHQKQLADMVMDLVLNGFPMGRSVREVIREISQSQERKARGLYAEVSC